MFYSLLIGLLIGFMGKSSQLSVERKESCMALSYGSISEGYAYRPLHIPLPFSKAKNFTSLSSSGESSIDKNLRVILPSKLTKFIGKGLKFQMIVEGFCENHQLINRSLDWHAYQVVSSDQESLNSFYETMWIILGIGTLDMITFWFLFGVAYRVKKKDLAFYRKLKPLLPKAQVPYLFLPKEEEINFYRYLCCHLFHPKDTIQGDKDLLHFPYIESQVEELFASIDSLKETVLMRKPQAFAHKKQVALLLEKRKGVSSTSSFFLLTLGQEEKNLEKAIEISECNRLFTAYPDLKIILFLTPIP